MRGKTKCMIAYDARVSGKIANIEICDEKVCELVLDTMLHLINKIENGLSLSDLNLLELWIKYEDEFPLRWQAPSKPVDLLYENIQTVLRARLSYVSLSIFIRAMRERIPIFLIIYQRLLELLISQSGSNLNVNPVINKEQLYDQWQRFCK